MPTILLQLFLFLLLNSGDVATIADDCRESGLLLEHDAETDGDELWDHSVARIVPTDGQAANALIESTWDLYY